MFVSGRISILVDVSQTGSLLSGHIGFLHTYHIGSAGTYILQGRINNSSLCISFLLHGTIHVVGHHLDATHRFLTLQVQRTVCSHGYITYNNTKKGDKGSFGIEEQPKEKEKDIDDEEYRESQTGIRQDGERFGIESSGIAHQ